MRTHLTLALAATMILNGAWIAPAQARQDKHERAEHSERDERPSRQDRHDRSDRKERGHSSQGVLSRDEAARRAQRKYGGRVLSVDLLQSEEAPARYRVKLLSEGNVRTVDVDALED